MIILAKKICIKDGEFRQILAPVNSGVTFLMAKTAVENARKGSRVLFITDGSPNIQYKVNHFIHHGTRSKTKIAMTKKNLIVLTAAARFPDWNMIFWPKSASAIIIDGEVLSRWICQRMVTDDRGYAEAQDSIETELAAVATKFSVPILSSESTSRDDKLPHPEPFDDRIEPVSIEHEIYAQIWEYGDNIFMKRLHVVELNQKKAD